jgi:hypothetical protein
MQLLQSDELEVAFRENAIAGRDVAAGAFLVKVAERRATLLSTARVRQGRSCAYHDKLVEMILTEEA